jgi:hypothetical protein
MKNLYYKAVSKNQIKNGSLGPEYVWGMFTYVLKDNENEVETRKKIENKHFGDFPFEEVSVLKNPLQSFPLGTSKQEIEKQTEWSKIKTFRWLN